MKSSIFYFFVIFSVFVQLSVQDEEGEQAKERSLNSRVVKSYGYGNVPFGAYGDANFGFGMGFPRGYRMVNKGYDMGYGGYGMPMGYNYNYEHPIAYGF